MTDSKTKMARAMNVVVAKGSKAEKVCRSYAGRVGHAVSPEALVPSLPATPQHDLVDRGGKIIPELIFTNFFVGGQAAWDADDIRNIDRALAAAMSDRNLNNVMLQYFRGRPQITSTFRASQVLAGPPPASVSQNDLEARVRSLHGAGTLAGFDLANTVFNFLLPPGTILTDSDDDDGEADREKPRSAAFPVEEEASSLEGLGGFHGSLHVGPAVIYYAVGVFSQKLSGGRTNGIPVFDKPWKNVVATLYHELNEARTDPDVEDANRLGDEGLIGWTSNAGEEVGDFPVFEANPLTKVFREVPLTDGSGTVPVQFQYSNAEHGPEGPIPAPH
jgi:hypothetical protein